MMNKKETLSALDQSIFNAQKAASAMLTLTTLFNMAAMYKDGQMTERDKLPPLPDISALCDDLALKVEDALCSVRFEFEKHERTLKQ